MKKIFFFVVILMFEMMTYAQKYRFDFYMYPPGGQSFVEYAGGTEMGVSMFKFEHTTFDSYLIQETYIGLVNMSSRVTYRYHFEDNAVISDVQIRQNQLTGSTRTQDRITLFAFPDENKPYLWTETDRGDNVSGKSEYVYVMFCKKRTKAIKITKTTTFTIDKVKHKNIEKSYWVMGRGPVISYRSNEKGEERIVSKLNVDDEWFEGFAEIP